MRLWTQDKEWYFVSSNGPFVPESHYAKVRVVLVELVGLAKNLYSKAGPGVSCTLAQGMNGPTALITNMGTAWPSAETYLSACLPSLPDAFATRVCASLSPHS